MDARVAQLEARVAMLERMLQTVVRRAFRITPVAPIQVTQTDMGATISLGQTIPTSSDIPEGLDVDGADFGTHAAQTGRPFFTNPPVAGQQPTFVDIPGTSKLTFDVVSGIQVEQDGTKPSATVSLLPASPTQIGVVYARAQTFAGEKTFIDGLTVPGSGVPLAPHTFLSHGALVNEATQTVNILPSGEFSASVTGGQATLSLACSGRDSNVASFNSEIRLADNFTETYIRSGSDTDVPANGNDFLLQGFEIETTFFQSPSSINKVWLDLIPRNFGNAQFHAGLILRANNDTPCVVIVDQGGTFNAGQTENVPIPGTILRFVGGIFVGAILPLSGVFTGVFKTGDPIPRTVTVQNGSIISVA